MKKYIELLVWIFVSVLLDKLIEHLTGSDFSFTVGWVSGSIYFGFIRRMSL